MNGLAIGRSVQWACVRVGVYGFVALLFALAADPALADLCKYSNGTSDNGPCMEVRNENDSIGDRGEMNLWCTNHLSHISIDHKIVLDPNPGSSFTCRGKAVKVQRVQADCNFCYFNSYCGTGKAVLTLKWSSRLGKEVIEHTCR